MLTLGEVVAKYPWTVFDTSILETEGSSGIEAQYRRELKRMLGNRKLVTVKDVVSEAWKWIKRDGDIELFRRVKWHQVNLESVEVEYLGMFEHLVERAKALHIVDPRKAYPYTDVKVAAYALTLARREANVALISGDRRLNELVNSEAKMPLLPEDVHLDVYSFVKHRGLFMPYVEEKALHGEGFPFTSSRSPSLAVRREPVREGPGYNISSRP